MQPFSAMVPLIPNVAPGQPGKLQLGIKLGIKLGIEPGIFVCEIRRRFSQQ